MNYIYQYVKFTSTSTFEMPDGDEVTEFILSTQQADLGYGSADRKILNKNLTIGDIRYQVSNAGLQQVQNTTISFSNVGQFYHFMREINGDDFWNTLQIDIFWASGRVPSLVYDGANWLEDGETIVAFTPSEPYPLTDSIKKEFSGSLSSASMSKDKVVFSLVSESKQKAYLIGSIQSFNGADSSRSLISPIVLGDLTDENAYVPLILKNGINTKSTAICSDIDLEESPTIFIYDDENEKFHEVINDQKATNSNKQIEFYDEDEDDTFDVESDFVEQSKDNDPTDGPILNILTTGEVVGYFTEDKDYVLFEDYTDPSEYNILTESERLRDEGARDYNGDGIYTDGNEDGFLVDSDMTVGIAKLNLSLYPTNLKTVPPLGDDIDTPVGANLTGYYGFTQDPSGGDDFEPSNNINYENSEGFFGSYKNTINFKGTTPRVSRDVPSFDDATSSLWVSAHAREDDNVSYSVISSGWEYYNYTNKLRVGVSADFEKFKYDSEILDFKLWFYGGVYKNWFSSTDTEAFDISGAGFNPRKSYVVAKVNDDLFSEEKILHDDSSTGNNEFSIGDNFDVSYYNNLSEFYAEPPTVTFNSYTTYNPVKSTNPSNDPPIASECYLDRVDPSFFGASRFAVDGMRVDAQVKASIESKYWCFKGKTGDAQTLNEGLNTLADRYDSTAFTSGDGGRSSWLLAGAHTDNTIYYRDLLAKISDEFRVFVTDKNGGSEIVSMGVSSDPTLTIDESNIFTPWNDNIVFSETNSTEIYNKIVVRYAKNHMIKKYAKTVSITADEIQRTFGVEEFDDVEELQGFLEVAKNTLSKIGIDEKVKTIDLDWVRDDYTANKILKWWCRNVNKQRAIITAEVSKSQFITAKVGDVIGLDLPSLPEFYQVNYQVKKIINKSDKKIVIEGEQIIDVDAVSDAVLRIEQAEVSMMTMDNSNGQQYYQLNAVTENGTGVDNSNLNWASDDPSVVSVSSSGLLESVGIGIATISCTGTNGTFYCDVWSYATVPDVTTLKTLRGGYGGNTSSGSGIENFFALENEYADNEILSFRAHYETFPQLQTSFALRVLGVGGVATRIIIDSSQYRLFLNDFTASSGTGYRINPALTPTVLEEFDVSKGSDGIMLNGSSASIDSTVTEAVSSTAQAVPFWVYTNYFIYLKASISNLSSTDLLDDSNVEMSYNFKDYIKLSDNGVFTNKVIVPNRGTLGSAQDMGCENVTSNWFTGA